MKNEQDLVNAITELATAAWANDKRPLLISNIPRNFDKNMSEFRSIVGEEGMKNFVKRTSATGGYKLVEDPTQRARVGIIPSAVEYEFPTTPAAESSKTKKQKGEVILAFLRVLGELSEDDQRSVVIPVAIVAKLLQK